MFPRLRQLALLACGIAAFTAPTLCNRALAADTASGSLLGTDGTAHGNVHVTAAPHGVLVRITAQGLIPGWHGIHFHEKGNCSAPKFTSAGAHVHATTPVVHGLLNANANDAGDLPNIFVGPDGNATVELYSTLVTLNGTDGRPGLLDTDGSSLVIHANPDDYRSQPIGGAGDRVACAALR
ncbi:superoxide dismutase family protein [Novacetimonas hansenii]|uniref:Superoxide dismutase family protein n=1 Tax=Novacetimonas hansenii TaxID=436 RepID=A0AAW5ETV2_NOVHA|nr:superoxide dismutase family protein [Novacetimonas hansenii]MBL7235304.1 superoxide dismutase family protein [Novacetimonas hansenii]MCJ8354221.1 superoxide dismutase family protein [Novacetimonas hansenii]QOF95683.1 superoxide dismutase family protein [Novacetimonas hansenii]RFP02420.1 superoxide dismutase [Novacetimonas hansenii]WEQ58581.1 superoxide dismutase family protein [Novacetimonas hansenii]